MRLGKIVASSVSGFKTSEQSSGSQRWKFQQAVSKEVPGTWFWRVLAHFSHLQLVLLLTNPWAVVVVVFSNGSMHWHCWCVNIVTCSTVIFSVILCRQRVLLVASQRHFHTSFQFWLLLIPHISQYQASSQPQFFLGGGEVGKGIFGAKHNFGGQLLTLLCRS